MASDPDGSLFLHVEPEAGKCQALGKFYFARVTSRGPLTKIHATGPTLYGAERINSPTDRTLLVLDSIFP